MYTLTVFGNKYKTTALTAGCIIIGMLVMFICSLIGVMRIAESFGYSGWLALALLGLLTVEVTFKNNTVYTIMPIAIVRKVVSRISFFGGLGYFIYSLFI